MKKSINKNWTAKLAALALAINLNLDRGVDISSDQTEEEQ